MTRNHARCALVVILPSALLTACGGAPSTPSAPPRAVDPVVAVNALPSGAIGQAEARRIHDRYLRLGDRGHAGLALEISRARPRQWPPPSEVRFVIPRPLPGSPRWFLAMRTHATVHTQLVFQETNPGWRVVAGTTTPAGYRLPEPAIDADGHAIPLDERAKGLTATPRQVAHAHAISLASMHAHPEARDLLASGTHTSEAARGLLAEQAIMRGQWALSITSRDLPGIHALRTKDGGAMAWYGIRERQTFTPVADPHVAIRFSRPQPAALSRGRSFASRAVIKAASWFVAVIPPAGSAAKAAVVGDWYTTTSVHGS